MKRARHKVSDHALLRWFERAHGVPVEDLRRQLELRIDAAADRMGEGWPACSAAHVDGMTFRITNGVVATVVPGKSGNRRHPGQCDD